MVSIEQVKRDLPSVPVKVGKHKYMARVSGRLNKEATVTLSYIEHGSPRHYLRGNPWMDWQFSWEAVAKAVNTGKPLLVA